MEARERLGQFSGAVLVAKGGVIQLEKGYGFADFEQAVPNSASTKFAGASLTKQFTAAAILQLSRAGKLALSDSLCRYIESCPSAWSAITIDQLVHHTSGIPDYEQRLELGSDRYAQFMSASSNVKKILDSTAVLPLDFPPGTKFSYSNTGYLLLAKVIARVSGLPFEVYLRDHIFQPARMLNTGVLTGDRFMPGLATGYAGGGGKSIADAAAGIPLLNDNYYRSAPLSMMADGHGDGGLVTTVRDLYAWDRDLRQNKTFSKETQQTMFAAGKGNYAFGWFIGTALGQSNQKHNGLLPGFGCQFDRFPDADVTIIVMANTEFARVDRISRDLAAIALGKPYDVPVSRQLFARDSASESKYAGTYVLAGGAQATVQSGARFLELRVPGRFTAGLIPGKSNRFYAPFFEGDVTFSVDASGAVDGFNLHYDGEDHVARRRP